MASGLRTPAGLATAAPQALVSTSVASAEQATMVFRFTLSNLRHCGASPGDLGRKQFEPSGRSARRVRSDGITGVGVQDCQIAARVMHSTHPTVGHRSKQAKGDCLDHSRPPPERWARRPGPHSAATHRLVPASKTPAPLRTV